MVRPARHRELPVGSERVSEPEARRQALAGLGWGSRRRAVAGAAQIVTNRVSHGTRREPSVVGVPDLDRPRLALYVALALVACFLGARYLGAQAAAGRGDGGRRGGSHEPADRRRSRPVSVGRAGGGASRCTSRARCGGRASTGCGRARGSTTPCAARAAPRARADYGGQPRREGGGRAAGRRPARSAGGGGGRGRRRTGAAGARRRRRGAGRAAAAAAPVNLNTATVEQLDTLDGVGRGSRRGSSTTATSTAGSEASTSWRGARHRRQAARTLTPLVTYERDASALERRCPLANGPALRRSLARTARLPSCEKPPAGPPRAPRAARGARRRAARRAPLAAAVVAAVWRCGVALARDRLPALGMVAALLGGAGVADARLDALDRSALGPLTADGLDSRDPARASARAAPTARASRRPGSRPAPGAASAYRCARPAHERWPRAQLGAELAVTGRLARSARSTRTSAAATRTRSRARASARPAPPRRVARRARPGPRARRAGARARRAAAAGRPRARHGARAGRGADRAACARTSARPAWRISSPRAGRTCCCWRRWSSRSRRGWARPGRAALAGARAGRRLRPLAGGGPSIQRAGGHGRGGARRGAGRAAVVALVRAAARGRGDARLEPTRRRDPGWQLSFAAVVGLLALAPACGRGCARRGCRARWPRRSR